jgi:hypothetical protein
LRKKINKNWFICKEQEANTKQISCW